MDPATIQLYGSLAVYLIQTGKVIGSEIAGFIRGLAQHNDPALTDEQLNQIAAAVEADATVREALSRAEAGQTE